MIMMGVGRWVWSQEVYGYIWWSEGEWQDDKRESVCVCVFSQTEASKLWQLHQSWQLIDWDQLSILPLAVPLIHAGD